MAEAWTGAGDPPVVDVNRPSVARVYDYLLGGRHHFAADRRAADLVLAQFPDADHIPKDSRDLLRRVVAYLVGEVGIRQIVDLGSGLPTTGNVHEFAHRIDPSVRVVYVDNDPMVVAHARALLGDDATTAALEADARDLDAVLDDPVTRGLVDRDQPLAVLASGILHHMTDAEAEAASSEIVARLTPGSYFMIGNFLDDGEPMAKELERTYGWGGAGIFRFRSRAEQERYLDGLEMVEPGLVCANDWRPDGWTTTDSPMHRMYAGGLGRKRG